MAEIQTFFRALVLRAAACILCLAAISLTSCQSQPQKYFIDGREVEKVEQRWGVLFPLPLSDGVSQVYYGYRDRAGTFVLHGPKRLFNRAGKQTYEAFFVDGRLEGTSTYWDESGAAVQVREFWRNGAKIGSAQYSGSGDLEFYNEDIYADSVKVAHKSYSYKSRQWALCSYKSGDLAIDPGTGRLLHSSGSMAKQCVGP